MRIQSLIVSLIVPILFLSAVLISAQTPKEYPDGHGGKVMFPLGDLSFADEVVSFEIGTPRAAEAESQPKEALGIPNFDEKNDKYYVTMSCSGTLTLRFIDNALVDVPGPDLYVFEIGPGIEATTLSISAEGKEWIEVGAINGGRADVDIGPRVQPGDVFHYVRLTDLKAGCFGSWPGADIDAVGAIGAAVQFSLNGSVLFDTGKADLKNEAKTELERLAMQIADYQGGRVTVEGHTDNVGSDASNLTLSQNRARAVAGYLRDKPGLAEFSFASKGYGESRPATSNETPEGQSRNRRVDVVLIPGAK